jgi:hypothetical protein
MQSKTMTLLIYKADNQHIWDSLIHQNWMKKVWNIQFVEYLLNIIIEMYFNNVVMRNWWKSVF